MVRTALPLIIALLSPYALAAQLECRVIGVADGDTLTCLTADRKSERIRLRGIDAPESKQPFGQRSKQNLSDLAYGKPALVDWQKRDRWKRIIGTVWVEPADCPGCGYTLDTGRAQLATGMAWWFKRYANDQPREERHAYAFEEFEARSRSVGLWRDSVSVPPWDWRSGKR